MRTAGLPATTVRQRTYHLGRVARELGGTPATVSVEALTAWLAGKDWKPNTRRSYRASLRAFYGWGLAAGRVTSSPAHLLPPVRVPRSRPRPTPEVAFRFAMRSADPRARLAIMLAGVCGLRRGELARARRDDLEEDLTGWSLRVVGKGGHVRMVPVPDELALEIRSRAAGWLFPSPHGGHLTPHHLGKLVSRHLPDGLTTHTLRHRCGTVAYAETKDLLAVQTLLGHAKPETTAIYVEVPMDSVRDAMRGALSGWG
jgi:integrase/recombinase XerC